MSALCLLYTADADLSRRIHALLSSEGDVRTVSDPADLKREIELAGSALVLFDIRGRESQPLLREAVSAWPDCLFVVLGTPRSEPMLMAEALEVHAVEDLEIEGRSLQALARRAIQQLHLAQEIRILRDQSRSGPSYAENALKTPPDSRGGLPLRETFPPLRHFKNFASLVQGIIDGIASSGVVLRAGVFAFSNEHGAYRLAAARACPEPARKLAFRTDDPLVRWLEINAQIVSRAALEHISSIDHRRMLQRALDTLGAELLVPLQGQVRLIGWLFLGRRGTGQPFDTAEVRDVAVYAEHVAMAIENAMLYEEVALQKTFAETLLHSLPTGIVASDDDGRIQWISAAAERILNIRSDDLIRQPAEQLGSRIASRLRLALQDDPQARQTEEWTDARTKRFLAIQTARLMSHTGCLGAVAFIHDHTQERMLAQRQREVDRSAFWTELAANMSHEVRNPLVTIKTFAQLLPERYADPEFRNEFSALMSQEVDRLNAIIEQINTFANLPPPVLKSLEIREAVNDALELAKMRVSPNGIVINAAIGSALPRIRGDRRALAECFAHILTNSMDVLHAGKDPRIDIDVSRAASAPYPGGGVEVVIRDNGGGIPAAVRDHVFSPFCTTKHAGMGLGLPIAQRTVLDHDGQIHIDSSDKGTTVMVVLPAEPKENGDKP